MKIFKTVLFFMISAVFTCAAQSPLELPLFNIENLEFKGGFRLPANDFGVSDLNFSQGPITYNHDNQSIFIVGHTYQQAIAEFEIPEINEAINISDLEMADNPIQDFVSILDRAESGNTQNINRIGGLQYTDGNLIVNSFEYYDANGDVTHSTLKLPNADNLAASTVEGFYSFQGGAGQTSGWISPLPPEWAELLEADFITGQSSGIPIISRTSVGPTAYTFKKDDLSGDQMISTSQYLDFSYPNGMHPDLDNSEGENEIWTHLSQVTYGFIVPGTRTYLTLGKSGGHSSGVCYKCTQDDGNTCGGYCTPEASDNYQYYWLWDMKDLMEVNAGLRLPHSVQPYNYGVFDSGFQSGFNKIGGGTYDPISNQLFLTVQGADRLQGTYSNPPVIAVFEPLLASVVPVQWIEFSAEEEGGLIRLEWEVEASEIHDFYEVFKLIRGEWELLGSTHEELSFLDRSPVIGENTYQIKQTDLNGSYTYSPIRSAVLKRRASEAISPNPVRDILIIVSEQTEVYIYDIRGQLMLRTSKHSVDVSEWHNGIYLARLGQTYYRIIKE